MARTLLQLYYAIYGTVKGVGVGCGYKLNIDLLNLITILEVDVEGVAGCIAIITTELIDGIATQRDCDILRCGSNAAGGSLHFGLEFGGRQVE